jgi:hypothetical protein
VRRADLEHIIRAAGAIANSKELIIVGSQAILGSFPDAPAELLASQEADTYPADAPDKADLIDGSIGEKSPFHETFGYYAHGISPETAVLPRNWRSRITRVQNPNTNGIAGLCIGPVDLAVSKLIAGREKDIAFVTTMLRRGLIPKCEINEVLPELDPLMAKMVKERLERINC